MNDREKHNRYNNEWAKLNRDKINNYYHNWKKKRYAWYSELKRGKGCCDCGEKHPACLDFHHKDPKQKIDIIRRLVLRGFNYGFILEEVGKCILLCSNCHRKRHWKDKEKVF